MISALLLSGLSSCGDGRDLTQANESTAAVRSWAPGVTPFIELVTLAGTNLSLVASVNYAIDAKPGASARRVDVTYSAAALARLGYAPTNDGALTFPAFGLYAGRSNTLRVTLQFKDGSTRTLAPLQVDSAPYVDPTAVYAQPMVLVKRMAAARLGFDYFAVKSALGTPIVIDTDGEIRWVAKGLADSRSTIFDHGAFLVAPANSANLVRLELDGSMETTALADPTVVYAHHNIDAGKTGLLAEFTTRSDGVTNVESTIAEITSTGEVLHKWDFAELISDFMARNGDDPALFVRPGVDWFHSNAATYDPSDDSLIVSSRENFIMKVDYQSGDILWILGDPTKYWYTFPSLRSKAITVQDGGLYPIGQHATSITPDGLLLIFNDGLGSVNQPAGAPAGASRPYSAVSAYSIDAAHLTAREAWSFDYGRSIYSSICSSAYETPDKSTLVTYATADSGASARVIGLDPDKNVVFDFKYVSPALCATAWNSVPIPFDAMNID